MVRAPGWALAPRRPDAGGSALNEILVDTDVVSYLLNRHSLAEEYEKLLFGYRPMVSFITVAEMYRGAYKKSWVRAGWPNLLSIYAGSRSCRPACRYVSHLICADLKCSRGARAADRHCGCVHRCVCPLARHPSGHE